jgi:hypothetical protein
MAKARKDALEQRIAEAAQIFATEVVSLIGQMTLDDLALFSGGGGGGSGAGVRALKNAFAGRSLQGASSVATAAGLTTKRRRSWPICGLPGCGKSYYPASGKARLCYEHFLGSGGTHPSKRK